MPALSFNEIMPGKSVPMTNDGFLYVVDLVMMVIDKPRNYSGYVLRNLPEEIFSSTLKIIARKIPGRGNHDTKLISPQNAIELLMVLPGKIAKNFRVQFSDIIKRYLAGDSSLIVEIQENAVSQNAINVLARHEPPPVIEDSEGVKSLESCEDDSMESTSVSGRKRDLAEMLAHSHDISSQLEPLREGMLAVQPLMREIAGYSQKTSEGMKEAVDSMKAILDLKKQMLLVDDQGYAKESQHKEQIYTKEIEHKDQMYASELEHIKLRALAQAEAVKTVAKAEPMQVQDPAQARRGQVPERSEDALAQPVQAGARRARPPAGARGATAGGHIPQIVGRRDPDPGRHTS